MGSRCRVAKEREILALYTSVMRGEVNDWTVSKRGDGMAVAPVPAGVKARMDAAEMLSRHYGMFRESRQAVQAKGAAEEISRMMQEMEGGGD